MKTRLSRILTAVCVIVLMVSFMAISASAATAGTMISNAVKMTIGNEYYKIWTRDTDHLNHYSTFTLTERGIVTIRATKPYDSEGEYGRMKITLYDGDCEPILDNYTFYAVDNVKPYYEMKAGLDAGTYYFTLLPGFSVYSGLIETAYSVNFQATPYCEVEGNETTYDATFMEPGKFYTGFSGNDYGDYGEFDYYKFNVTAGQEYRITMKNFGKIDATSTSIYLVMPGDSATSLGYYMSKNIDQNGDNYVNVNAKANGTAYIYFDNHMRQQVEYTICVNTYGYPSGNTLYYEGGKWYHVVDRQKVKDTTLVNYGGKWWYIKDGVHTTATTLVKYGSQWFYVKNGFVDFTANTLVKYGGLWYNIKGGKWAKETKLVPYSGQLFYVKNGTVDFTANTLVQYGNKWYHVSGGKWVKDTAMVSYGGTLYYVKNGTVDFTAKGFTYCNGNWYNLSAGKVVKSTTLINYGGKWWYVKDGVWTKSTTLVKYGGTWYYVQNGIVNYGTNTLVKYGNSWYHVKGGKWVKDTALVGLGGTTYYVKNGLIDFTANGLTYCSGNWYNLSKGAVLKTSTLVKYGGKWWYVKSGVWTKVTTLVKYGTTWYYVKDGIVDFAFSGTVPYGGKYYTVKNGKMVS